jgi:hypothetical protein
MTSGEMLHPFCCQLRRADRISASSHKREHIERRAATLMITRDNISSITLRAGVMGILMDNELLLLESVQGKRVLRSLQLPADVSEPDRLLNYLWGTGLDSVWVMPATTLSRSATCSWLEQASSRWVVRVHPYPQEPSRPIRAQLWPKEHNQRQARRLALAFPEYAGWDWELTDARSLLAKVSYLEQVLTRSVTDPPELLAQALLTDLTRDAAISPLSSSPVDRCAFSCNGATPVPLSECARDVVWMRPLSVMEQRQRYVHKYVHLSRHLQAAMAAPLGVGAPQYSANGRGYDGMRPGIWRTHVELAGSVFDGKQLPSGLDGEWMSTHQVRCCQDIGYRVQVREGWYWQEAHDLLKGWGTTLWQAASRLHIHTQIFRHALGRANALHSISSLAELGISILAQEQTALGWSRPDWWIQIVGLGRALLFGQLVGLVKKGIMPVLVQRDAFWVISDEAHPPSAVPGLLTPQQWRGYTVGYQAPLLLTSEVRDAFKCAQHAGELSLALDTLAGEVLP